MQILNSINNFPPGLTFGNCLQSSYLWVINYCRWNAPPLHMKWQVEGRPVLPALVCTSGSSHPDTQGTCEDRWSLWAGSQHLAATPFNSVSVNSRRCLVYVSLVRRLVWASEIVICFPTLFPYFRQASIGNPESWHSLLRFGVLQWLIQNAH